MIIFLLCLALPSSAALNQIQQGGTVFVGEQDLDITGCGLSEGDQIAWWAPGSARSSEPAQIVTISDPHAFYVAPSTFSDCVGPWYRYPEGYSVLSVKKPSIKLSVYDETAGFDGTGKWIPKGDLISFTIESNLYETGRRGASGEGQIDITIKSPQGGEYTSLSGPSGPFSLSGILVTSSLYNTGPVWNTASLEAGTYDVYAEVALNDLKNNNPAIGEGRSETKQVLIQGVNPLIKGVSGVQVNINGKNVVDTPHPTVVTTVPTTAKTTIPTTVSTIAVTTVITTVPTTAHVTSVTTTVPTAIPTTKESPLSLMTGIFALTIVVMAIKLR